MSTQVEPTPPISTGSASTFRVAFAAIGVLAIALGIAVLIWPGRTAVVVTALFAGYAVVTGVVYAAMTFFVKEKSGWWRIGHALLALLFIVAGISAFSSLKATAAFLTLFLAIMVGVTWLIEGIVALTLIGRSNSKGWSAFFAILSIVAGLVILSSPLWGVVVLWWLLAYSFIALGLVQLIRAFTFGKPVKVS